MRVLFIRFSILIFVFFDSPTVVDGLNNGFC